MSGIIMKSEAGLLDVEKALAFLAECQDLSVIKKVRDQAEAMARYLRAQKAGDDSATRASIIAREAEARGGELLKGLQLQGTRGKGRPATNRPAENEPPKSQLATLGLKPAESKRMHAAASVPKEEREKVYEAAQKAKRPVAANALPKIARQKRKVERINELRKQPLPQPSGRFNVIVIDPPWRYESRTEDITHRGRNPYPDMAINEIKALPVTDHAEDNCVLWLWTTNSFMREAFECLDAWGFQHKTILTWAKDRMGTGDWLRGKTEHCLLSVRGRPLVELTNQTTLLQAPLREHSRKPDEFYTMIEALCPGTRLEFFAREQRTGWQAWGAETDHFTSAA
jgi:N6-adenosine-specific RNA methylase IME4